MPLLPFAHTPIAVPVSPHAATGLAQTAAFTGLSVTISPVGDTTMNVQTRVDFHHPATGALIADSPGIIARPVPLVADNNCAVYYDPATPDHPRNGQILYYLRGADPAVWGTVDAASQFTPLVGGLAATPEPLLLQGQWVEVLLLSMLAPLIKQNMAQADLPPFNRYS